MPPDTGTGLSLLRAFEGALREGRLLDESIGGILDARARLLRRRSRRPPPAGGAPPISRAGRSLIAAAAEQNLTKLLEEILVQGARSAPRTAASSSWESR